MLGKTRGYPMDDTNNGYVDYEKYLRNTLKKYEKWKN